MYLPIYSAYDVSAIVEVCDWIGIMNYDIYTQTYNKTAIVAPFNVLPDSEKKHLQSSVVSTQSFDHFKMNSNVRQQLFNWTLYLILSKDLQIIGLRGELRPENW